ncbi:TolC family protein [Acetobacter indonesiensis]|uniref:TolC family protein n=1 Tax=Acetobacter indonesiensis TaxID=104101 RepID=UPI0020A5A973|nr:TolC family protein [Acetobacter indonesiensis]MCP1230878.1 TolC family protein [Acetobacter indonesiensis]
MRLFALSSALMVSVPLLWWPVFPAWGQDDDASSWSAHTTHAFSATEQTDVPPAVSGGRLSFPAALALAWRMDPARNELGVNQKAAKSRAKAARSWFAGGPTVSGNYFDDHFIGSNEGYTTYQGEVSVPLWLPGQGSATQSVAQAEADTAEKQAGVAHMSVAVRLLDATAAALLAQRRVETTSAFYRAASRISADVTHATRLGEMTLADQQMADATRDTARSDCAMAQEEAQTAAAALEALLGAPSIPDITAFTATESAAMRLANSAAIEENDPRVQAARKETEAARAAMQLARRSFMPNPELGVGAIHEKQYGSPWDNRVGVTLSMPLPSSVHNAPLMAAARNRVAAADRQDILARRMVRQEIAQARARLQSSMTTLQSARNAATDLEKRATLLERSWKLQETPLDDAIRARQAAYTAALTRDRAEIVWHAAIVRALIATGDLPGLNTRSTDAASAGRNKTTQSQGTWATQNMAADPQGSPDTSEATTAGLRIPASLDAASSADMQTP